VARAIDGGALRGTTTRHFGALSPATRAEARCLIESGRGIGKVVLEGLAADR
jgi:hypothetical protein